MLFPNNLWIKVHAFKSSQGITEMNTFLIVTWALWFMYHACMKYLCFIKSCQKEFTHESVTLSYRSLHSSQVETDPGMSDCQVKMTKLQKSEKCWSCDLIFLSQISLKCQINFRFISQSHVISTFISETLINTFDFQRALSTLASVVTSITKEHTF